MALPTNSTNVTISAPGSVPLPPAGYVTYFFNTSDGNRLYYKIDDGTVYLATEYPSTIDSCVCCLMNDFTHTLRDALLSEVMTPAEYNTALANGFQVVLPGGNTYQVSSITS